MGPIDDAEVAWDARRHLDPFYVPYVYSVPSYVFHDVQNDIYKKAEVFDAIVHMAEERIVMADDSFLSVVDIILDVQTRSTYVADNAVLEVAVW